MNFSTNNASNTSSVLQSLVTLHRHEVNVFTTVSAIICAFGSFTNLLMMLVTWPTSQSSSGFDILIFNSVSANCFMCLVILPVRFVMIQLKQADRLHVIPNACTYFHGVTIFTFLWIAWAEVCLAVNRCVALLFPYNYKSCSTKAISFAMVLITWLYCVPFPVTFGLKGMPRLLPLGSCALSGKGVFTGVVINVILYVPYAVVGGLASVIFWRTYSTLWTRPNTVMPWKTTRFHKVLNACHAQFELLFSRYNSKILSGNNFQQIFL